MTTKQLLLLKKLEAKSDVIINYYGDDWLLQYNEQYKNYMHHNILTFPIEWLIKIIKSEVEGCEVKEI